MKALKIVMEKLDYLRIFVISGIFKIILIFLKNRRLARK